MRAASSALSGAGAACTWAQVRVRTSAARRRRLRRAGWRISRSSMTDSLQTVMDGNHVPQQTTAPAKPARFNTGQPSTDIRGRQADALDLGQVQLQHALAADAA